MHIQTRPAQNAARDLLVSNIMKSAAGCYFLALDRAHFDTNIIFFPLVFIQLYKTSF